MFLQANDESWGAATDTACWRMPRRRPIFFQRSGRILQVATKPTLMTANEAASVTGVPLRQVHRIIDAGIGVDDDVASGSLRSRIDVLECCQRPPSITCSLIAGANNRKLSGKNSQQ